MGMLNFDSTGMYTILALIVNFKWNACKTNVIAKALKLLVILAQCRYTKIAQKYLNIVVYNIPVLPWIKTEQFGI